MALGTAHFVPLCPGANPVDFSSIGRNEHVEDTVAGADGDARCLAAVADLAHNADRGGDSNVAAVAGSCVGYDRGGRDDPGITGVTGQDASRLSSGQSSALVCNLATGLAAPVRVVAADPNRDCDSVWSRVQVRLALANTGLATPRHHSGTTAILRDGASPVCLCPAKNLYRYRACACRFSRPGSGHRR